jgi:hypothetical protein
MTGSGFLSGCVHSTILVFFRQIKELYRI